MLKTREQVTWVPPYQMDHYDQEISIILSNKGSIKNLLDIFLNRPYRFEPLGEGETGFYSQEPLYRTDVFDCVSWVNIMLALFSARNLATFKKNLFKIRYRYSQINYHDRTDWFTDLEWIPNLTELDFITDIMHEFRETTKMAETVIDKPSWYAAKTLRALHLFSTTMLESAEIKLKSLQQMGPSFTVTSSHIEYLPWNYLLDSSSQLNQKIMQQIPLLSVIVMVRPNWSIKQQFRDYPNGYGTNLNVSHLGILHNISKDPEFYHASSIQQKIVCEPFREYLQQSMQEPTMQGVNIQAINSDKVLI